MEPRRGRFNTYIVLKRASIRTEQNYEQKGAIASRFFASAQPVHNVLRTTPIGLTLVETSRTIKGPKQDVSGFSLILTVHCLIYRWNQEK